MNLRTCIGCRRADEAENLVRVRFRSGGRGAWLHPACVEVAGRRRGFSRSWRRAVDDRAIAEALCGGNVPSWLEVEGVVGLHFEGACPQADPVEPRVRARHQPDHAQPEGGQ